MHKPRNPFIIKVKDFFMGNCGQILIADDDSDFVVLLQVALKNAGFSNEVQSVETGLKFNDYLEGRAEYANREAHPMPALVFVDLKLPARHGFELLRWIRKQPELNELIVVMMSGFSFTNEAQVAHDLGANAFMAKPLRFDSLVRTLEQQREAWCPSGPAQPVAERESQFVEAGQAK